MRRTGAFTLVEILIVVVILGILAGIVVPQFTNATRQAGAMATKDQLVKIREALAVYFVRNASQFPEIQNGSDPTAWAELMGTGEYLRKVPENFWVDPSNSKVVVIGNQPDAAYQTDHGWIYDPASGNLWAGSFDGNDNPYPKP
jgi:general secretion pathway protein G